MTTTTIDQNKLESDLLTIKDLADEERYVAADSNDAKGEPLSALVKEWDQYEEGRGIRKWGPGYASEHGIYTDGRYAFRLSVK